MKRVKKIAAYLFLTVASVISVFPLYWMISAGRKTSPGTPSDRELQGADPAAECRAFLWQFYVLFLHTDPVVSVGLLYCRLRF